MAYVPRTVKVNGKLTTLRAAAEANGVSYSVARERIRSGWTIERAVSEPVTRQREIECTDPYGWARANVPWKLDLEAQRIVAEHPGGMGYEEIAKVFRTSRQRIQQIEESALRKLRNLRDGRRLLRALLADVKDEAPDGPYSLRG